MSTYGNSAAMAKYGKFGLGLQTAEGSENAGTSVVWMPMCDAPSFKWHANGAAIDAADGAHYEHQHYSQGQFWAGSVGVFMYPGAVSTLISWIQTRDDNNQGVMATVWLVDKNATLVRTAMDVKVRTAEFPLVQNQPMRVNLDLVGKQDGTKSEPTGYDKPLLSAPFVRKDVTVVLKAASTEDTDRGWTFKGGTIRIDNQVQDPMDGMRFNGSYNPYVLYNTGAAICSGDCTRDALDLDFYNAWRQSYEVGSDASYNWEDDDYDSYMTVTYARGATTFGLSIPRMRIEDVDTGMLGSRRGIQEERITWVALADATTAATAPITLST